MDAGRLTADPVVAAAVERLLCRVVDLAVDINTHLVVAVSGRAPVDYASSFRTAVEVGVLPADLGARLVPSVGGRNVVTHHYARVDLDVVARAVPLALEGYHRDVTAVARHLSG